MSDPHARFDTCCVHAGQHPDPTTGAIMTPVYFTSTYVQQGLNQHKGFEYARTRNPTRDAVEGNLAALEGRSMASPSRAAWPPSRPCWSCSARATIWCSGTTSTAAPSGWWTR